MADVLDILDVDRPANGRDGQAAGPKKRGPKPKMHKPNGVPMKKPKGMHREVYGLLTAGDKDTPLFPTDFEFTPTSSGYKQVRANLSIKKPRAWKWTPFTNPSRKDGLILCHWRRVLDPSEEPKVYQFAQFNTSIDAMIPKYTTMEYEMFLRNDPGWTREETDHLMELCNRFDLRFYIVNDRWDRQRFPAPRSVEDLKDRYYSVYNSLASKSGQDTKLKMFDVETERKRKEQLNNLFNRTPEQIQEEQFLLNELKKIEIRKRERERKTQDLQKIMDAAEKSSDGRKSDSHHHHHHHHNHQHTPASSRSSTGNVRGVPGRRPGSGRGSGRPSRDSTAAGPSTPGSAPHTATSLLEATTSGVKFPDLKTSGASLRSSKMKLPVSIGNKKVKSIELMLEVLGIELNPMPTEPICQSFNELRAELVLIHELKVALQNCEYEIQSLKNQYEAAQPGKTLDVTLPPVSSTDSTDLPKREISDVIDVASAAATPGRKRKAALEQQNLLRKLKRTA